MNKKVLIVHAHPEPQSFNGALTRHAQKVLAEEGYDVVVSDLYAMGWNPVSDRSNFVTEKNPVFFKQQLEELYATENDGFAEAIREEMRKVLECDVLIFQFPLWWFSIPAILKGWIDRVFAMGTIYGAGKWFEDGVFKGKRAMLSLTTGSPPTAYSKDGLHGEIDMLLYHVNHGTLRFTGFDVLPPFVAWGPSRVTDEVRQGYLAQYEERLRSLETTPPLAYPSVYDYDPETFGLKPEHAHRAS